MGTQTDLVCDVCQERIDHASETPLVAYLVVATVQQAGVTRFYDDELPPVADALLKLRIPRREYCMRCLSERFTVRPDEVADILRLAVDEHGLDRDDAAEIMARARAHHARAPGAATSA